MMKNVGEGKLAELAELDRMDLYMNSSSGVGEDILELVEMGGTACIAAALGQNERTDSPFLVPSLVRTENSVQKNSIEVK